jgi:hypothetical protein
MRERYGDGPLHLLSVLASFSIATYAFIELADQPGSLSFAVWFAGAIIAHDLIAFPLYSTLGLLAGKAATAAGGRGVRALNYVRVPALLSALLLVVWFPLIFGFSEGAYEGASGLDGGRFLAQWLLVSGGLFALSGAVYAVRSRRAPGRGRPTGPRPTRSPR